MRGWWWAVVVVASLLVVVCRPAIGTETDGSVSRAADTPCHLSLYNDKFSYQTTSALGLSKCTGMKTTSCCGDAWYTNVGSADPFSKALNQFVNATESCKAKVNKLSCGVCSTSQASFAIPKNYASVVNLCTSYCTSLARDCASSILVNGGSLVSTKYGNDGEWFCYDLFKTLEDNFVVYTLPDSAKTCFSDTKRECTEDDFSGYYSECNPATNTRDYYYVLKSDVDCAGGSLAPRVVRGLPCFQTCAPGSFLPPGKPTCETCKAGTYSIGGGYVFESWKEWPQVLSWDTYCEVTNGINPDKGVKITEGDCKGWVLNDTWIEVPAVLGDSQNAVVELRVNLVRDGRVTFAFKVNAEPLYDGLKFYVDDQVRLVYFSNSADFQTRSFDLFAGIRVLKWKFFKDHSNSKNWDTAFIRSIEILGTKFADEKCTECFPGSFSDVGFSRCALCPFNTYSDQYGASTCFNCPTAKYAYPGSIQCDPRLPCNASDVLTSYTKCENGLRNKVFSFTQPAICNTASYTLPPNQNRQPCSPCNPGQYRSVGSSTCRTCPPGTFSESGATTCNQCPAGTYALKEIFYTTFETFEELPGVSTSCSGMCGTTGWRLLSDDIDSGVGHGSIADVVLTIDVNLETDGVAEFNFSVICKDFCKMQFIDVNATEGLTNYYASEDTKVGPYSLQMPLLRGEHQIQVVFSKYVEMVDTHRDNRMIIHGFKITGVASGGASECSPCPAGYFSIQSSAMCSACPIGTYSNEGSSSCSLCPDGTFSTQQATSMCTPCGPGTISTPNRLGCDNLGCTFSPRSDVVFNLSSLQTVDDMYGPIWDIKNHAFYLNPCRTEHSNRTCYDRAGNPLSTHACQEVPMGYSMDLGNIMGYMPFDDITLATDPSDPIRSGLVMEFKNGSLGCPTNGTNPYPRSSRVTFICDPSAGIGYPEAVEPVEYSPCRYQFKWTSLYACPLCTMKDYQVVYGSCIDGYSMKTFIPKNYPNRCHGGIVPKAEKVSCTVVTKNCSAGTYFPLNSKEDGECVEAGVGKYSIGGGFVVDVFDKWENMPGAFARDSTWKLIGEVVRSDVGDTSLVASVYLVQSGFVSFSYKVVASGLEEPPNGGFYFDIDGYSYVQGITNTQYRYTTTYISLQPGTHILTWRFIGGALPTNILRGYYAVIDKITVSGTEYSARQDIECREGSYQNQTGQMTCKRCPQNTKSIAGQAACTPCPAKTYSLRGSSDCEFMTLCEPSDYSLSYSLCLNGKRTGYYLPLDPKTCYDEGPVFLNNGTVSACPPCPSGFITNTTAGVTTCSPCPLGEYVNNSVCKKVPEGSQSILKITYFSSEPTLEPYTTTNDSWPIGFRTSCSGRCGTFGWRRINNVVESGFHSVQSEVDSELFLETDFIQEGSISFKYTLNALKSSNTILDNGLPGFQFFIDGKPEEKSILFHPDEDVTQTATFTNIGVGSHVFHWIFHQPLGSNRNKRIILSDIEVIGSDRGSASEYKSCPRGTHSREGSFFCDLCPLGTYSNVGKAACSVCEPNKFADFPGSAQCEFCGISVNATADRTSCDTNGCIFTNTNLQKVYNLTSLNRLVHVKTADGESRLTLNICDKLTRTSQCFDANNLLINNTYICLSNLSNGVGKNAGRLLNVLYEKNAEEEEELRLKYTKGVNCGHSQSISQLYTDIIFVCDPNVTQFVPPEVQEVAPCRITLLWRHIASCPVCTNDDYVEQLGECVGGKQNVVHVRSSKCNGDEVKHVESRTCSPVYSVTLPIAIVGGAAFSLLILGLIIVGIRNKKMADQYQMLIANTNVEKDFNNNANSSSEQIDA